eukprot:CAMPEP_0179459742 /NCGR_PEP_ID=MMETSP0799-20121207/43013_1 /TAXON_ID=46947 /ORGANISM="Geminigera cryophila, Strain CCMP2564" /LENGTH=99 /DNA_ID=CAMNT_0021261739 /DNA_START=922 /DNA_END=1221 /DNA_ORIENTATION=+
MVISGDNTNDTDENTALHAGPFVVVDVQSTGGNVTTGVEPALQEHTTCPLTVPSPASPQDPHAVEPSSREYEPAPQSVHAPDPIASLYCPGAQGTHPCS